MPKYDFICPDGHRQIDLIVPRGTRPPCPTCGAVTEILWTTSFPNVIGDEIPGGMTIHNMTPTPETFYTKSAHRRRMRELGLELRESSGGRPDGRYTTHGPERR